MCIRILKREMSHRQTRRDESMWFGKNAVIRAFQPVQQEIGVLRRMARFNIRCNMVRYYTLLGWQCATRLRAIQT